MSHGSVAVIAVKQAEPYLEVLAAVSLGVCSAVLVFCKLQCGRQRANHVWVLVLMFSFVLCAYGLGLLLELVSEG
jgi:hypothetical protein